MPAGRAESRVIRRCSARRFALLTGRPVLASFAAATGALLLADAWFDVVAAAGPNERRLAVAFALVGEIPLAILCLVLARSAPQG